MFREVDSKTNFPRLEEKILRFWEEHQIFSQSVAVREGEPSYVFYEGPHKAKGRTGVHNALYKI